MSMVIAHIMYSDMSHKDEVFHLVLENDPSGSPSEEEWTGGRFAAHGLKRAQAIRFLRSLADRLENGQTLKEITEP